jgi:hypothetical protein
MSSQDDQKQPRRSRTMSEQTLQELELTDRGYADADMEVDARDAYDFVVGTTVADYVRSSVASASGGAASTEFAANDGLAVTSTEFAATDGLAVTSTEFAFTDGLAVSNNVAELLQDEFSGASSSSWVADGHTDRASSAAHGGHYDEDDDDDQFSDNSSLTSEERRDILSGAVEADDDIPATLDNVLTLNRLNQNKMRDFIEELQRKLVSNESRQREIDEQLIRLQTSSGGALATTSTGGGGGGSISKRSMAVFCAPYFKDVRGFTHPPNADTVKKRANHELDVYFGMPRKWSSDEKDMLVAAVREDAIRERLRPTVETTERLLREGKAKGVSKEAKEEILKKLADLKDLAESIKATSDEILFHNREEDFDWLRISAQTVSLFASIQVYQC